MIHHWFILIHLLWNNKLKNKSEKKKKIMKSIKSVLLMNKHINITNNTITKLILHLLLMYLHQLLYISLLILQHKIIQPKQIHNNSPNFIWINPLIWKQDIFKYWQILKLFKMIKTRKMFNNNKMINLINNSLQSSTIFNHFNPFHSH